MNYDKELTVENLNNKLNCDCFFVIDFAPPPMTLRDEHFEKVYLVRHDGRDIYLNLTNFWRVPFSKMGGIYTIPATGLELNEWQFTWKEKHPDTLDDTDIGIYCYRKIPDQN